MALVVGGVTHDPMKVRRRLEQARAASAIAVAHRPCIHLRCRRRRHHRHSSLSSPLQNAAVAFSASAIAAAASAAAATTAAVATAAVTIAVAAATTIAATAAVVDCYVFATPTP